MAFGFFNGVRHGANPVPASWDYFVTAEPAIEPITLAEVKATLSISGAGDDTLLTDMITEVRSYAECATKRTFISTEFETFRNGFSDFSVSVTGGDLPIELRKSPFLSIATFEYTDCEGNPQALLEGTDFFVEKRNSYSLLRPTDCWPTDSRDRQQSIKITFRAGFGELATDVPAKIRGAMRRHVNSYYNNRGDCCDCEGALDLSIKSAYSLSRILCV